MIVRPEVEDDNLTLWIEGETEFEKKLLREVRHNIETNFSDDAVGIYIPFKKVVMG